jgi:hypothetical protein
MNVRGEDQRLADELALGILGDGDGVAAGAGGAADESALGRRGLTLLLSVFVAEPTSMRKPFLKAVVLPLGI